MAPASDLTNAGKAGTLFTAGSTTGAASVTAILDGQSVSRLR